MSRDVRSAQIRSPKTAFDAQLRVDVGTSNSSGLIIIHSAETASGIRHHQPIQSRLQMEIANSETTLKRVQTLIGLACRIQRSPVRPNTSATLCSSVGAAAWLGGADSDVLIWASWQSVSSTVVIDCLTFRRAAEATLSDG